MQTYSVQPVLDVRGDVRLILKGLFSGRPSEMAVRFAGPIVTGMAAFMVVVDVAICGGGDRRRLELSSPVHVTERWLDV